MCMHTALSLTLAYYFLSIQIQYQFVCESILKAYEGITTTNTLWMHVSILYITVSG